MVGSGVCVAPTPCSNGRCAIDAFEPEGFHDAAKTRFLMPHLGVLAHVKSARVLEVSSATLDYLGSVSVQGHG